MNLKNLYQNEYSFEETVNENFFKVDSFTHLSIFGEISSSSDEENTVAKELYLIVPPQPDENGITTPDTLFQDKINQIACYHNNIGWLFYTPKIGDIAYIRNRNGFYYFTGAQWNIMTTGSSGGSSSTTPSTPTNNTGDTQSTTMESISLNNPFSLGMIIRSKIQLNHPSWLKSDATLKSGAVYASMYFALLDAFNNGTDGTITIGGNTYTTKTKDGFVVIDSANWQAIYSTYGIVAQFGIDTTNQQFYLPYGEESKRVLVESKKPTAGDTSWYNLYSDGWCEQGGLSSASTNIPTTSLSIPYKDTNYSIFTQLQWNKDTSPVALLSRIDGGKKTTTAFGIKASSTWTNAMMWMTTGYADTTSGVNITYYDYYYVGDTIQSSTAINIDTLLNRITTLENKIQQLENA